MLLCDSPSTLISLSLVLLLVLLQVFSDGVQVVTVDSTVCRTIPGLTRDQLNLCLHNVEATTAALQGLHLAVQECQHQFQGHRWNCSGLAAKSRNPHTSPLFRRGFKETAFAHAISSAGVAISVAKACSQGKIMSCGCDPSRYRDANSVWKWGGCSHNLQYGVSFSKLFLDSRERDGDIHSRINLHNNKAGRLLVKRNVMTKCKCHGVSGSCEMKTCWRSAPELRHVGGVLKERFRSAVLVEQNNLGNRAPATFDNSRLRGGSRRKQRAKARTWTPRKGKHKKRNLSLDLLYYQKSPTFCDRIPKMDIQGVSGRECNQTGQGVDSCSSLCCGRGYNLLRRKKCDCKFHWCCYVDCSNCTAEEFVAVCN